MSIAVSGTASKEQRNTIFQAGQKMDSPLIEVAPQGEERENQR